MSQSEQSGRTSLDGIWQLRWGPQDQRAPSTPQELAASDWPSVEAFVPGNVELDLLRAGKLPELARGNNIYALRELEGCRWWYSRTFSSPAQTEGRSNLVFEGLDCVATIFLNGQRVGTVRNMFVAYRFDVTDFLRRDGADNQLSVRIDSAVLEGRRHQPAAIEGAFATNWESLAVRKAPHMYGWDIMPRVISAGLWRSVRLETVPATRWTDVYFATLSADASARKASVLVDWHFWAEKFDIDRWQVRLTLSREGRVAYTTTQPVVNTHGRVQFEVCDAELWWPRGTGQQPLYDLTLDLLDENARVLDSYRERAGLRTIKLLRSDITTPEKPGEFVFVVNGEKVFVKGTNWVPLDAFHSRDKEHLPAAFKMLVDLNCNMVRCWGGNVYEDHDFFELCDRHGVMVWQDFALACAIYPQDDGFAEQIRNEAEAVVRKLRNHPSLALWAGNNEIDDAYGGWFGTKADPNTDRLSRQVLPNVVRQFDPCRDYLPSSPYHSPALVAAGNHNHLKPEDHLWGPRDDFKGAFYTGSPALFASEIGYHGCPDRRGLEQMMDPSHLWPWQDNEQWLTHATRPHPNVTAYNYRIPLMAKQTAVLFETVPDNLDDFILASQISQAEAKKFFIEWFRAGKFDSRLSSCQKDGTNTSVPPRTGILWWNLRDGWPIISDAVVDYYGRKKLAYHYIKRVQTDVCAICGEAGATKEHPLVIVNDTLADVSGHVSVRDLDTGTRLLVTEYRVERNGRTTAGTIRTAEKPAMWLIEWTAGTEAGTTGSQRFHNHYLAGPRPFKLDDYKRWLKTLANEIPGLLRELLV
ncbi:MAG TPA: glycoside hydrolase family 2 TIM barrel-domain containing protein [Planctomycetota bacterium]